jgi:acyl-CoA synthetase (NDP forming)
MTASPAPTRHALSPLFSPTSVAVIGASSDADRIGGRVLRFLLEAGYGGRLYPVNKSGAAEIQGLPAFASVTEIPGQVDQAIVLTPVAGVESAIRESIAKGVQCVLVLTAGFAEIGPEGRALQDRLRDLCRAAGVRMVGPNSLGILNLDNRYFATFSTVLYGLQPRAGRIALATQSGAFGSCAYGMASLRGMGFSQIVATGNEADVDVAECIDYFAGDPGTDVICAALESCRDGQRLRAALLKAALAGKPVLVMKVGRTELGAAAASTHTGSLAGNDAAFDAVFAECGALRPASIEAMLDIAYFCAVTGQLPGNPDMGVVTGSGGIGVLMADQAGESGLHMPPLPESGRQAALELLPFAVAANPLDMTAQVTSVPGGVGRAIEVMLQHGDYGSVMAYLAHSGLSPARFAPTLAQLRELRQRYPRKCLVLVMLSTPEVDAQLAAIGIPVFGDPTRAVAALAGAARIKALQRQLYQLPAPVQTRAAPLGDVSTEALAKQALGAAGLPVLRELLCASEEAAAAASRELGFPLVAKIASPDILHKTEIGGVLLGLQDEAAVRAAFAALMQRARDAVPQARLDGVLLAPMVRGGIETLLGVQVDPTFGPMVVFGAGGTAVELHRDVALASAPLTPERARALVDRVRSSALLTGWRGAPPLDVNALVRALCALSDFAMAHADELDSIDVNPLVVMERGAVCLDAVITRKA